MDELDFMMISFVEDPIGLEREADELGRIIMICFANAGETRDQSADRHEIGDEFIACVFPKLIVDVGYQPRG